MQGGELTEVKAPPVTPVTPVEKPSPMTEEMKVFCKENEKTPYFKEFTAFIALKTSNSELEMIRQGAQSHNKLKFLSAVKAYGAGIEKEKTSADKSQQRSKDNNEKAPKTTKKY